MSELNATYFIHIIYIQKLHLYNVRDIFVAKKYESFRNIQTQDFFFAAVLCDVLRVSQIECVRVD